MRDDITQQGSQLLQRWESAQRSLDFAKRALNSAQCEVSNATTELAKWLLPDDAKLGESFSIWALGGLLQAEKREDGTFTVFWRQPPKP